MPNATLLIQRREWEAGHNGELIESVYYDPHDYDHGHKVKMIDGEHDVFGDGSVVCIPTHGHTPGHQSLRVRIGAGEVVMTGDACYLRRTLDNFHLPTAMYDREQMLESIRRLRALRDGGAMIITGHDPELWKTIPQAPDRLAAVRTGGLTVNFDALTSSIGLGDHDGQMPECSEIGLMLGAAGDGELEPNDLQEVARHVERCASCTGELSDYSTIGRELRAIAVMPSLEGFTKSVLDVIAKLVAVAIFVIALHSGIVRPGIANVARSSA